MKIKYAPLAWARQCALVRHFDTEVSWIGLVSDDLLVYDIVVCKQVVSGAHATMDAEAYGKLTYDLLKAGNNTEHMRLLGHSHVNMTVSPSSTDEEMVESFFADKNEWFIEVIQNKRGDTYCALHVLKPVSHSVKAEIEVVYDGFGLDEWLETVTPLVKKEAVAVKTRPILDRARSPKQPSRLSEYTGTAVWGRCQVCDSQEATATISGVDMCQDCMAGYYFSSSSWEGGIL